jgi:hypothetical protein
MDTKKNLNLVLILLILFFSSCTNDNTKEVQEKVKDNVINGNKSIKFDSFCFSIDSNWIQKYDTDSLIAFVKKKEEGKSYKTNFSMMKIQLNKNSQQNIDELVVSNIKQLHDVYSKVNILSIDSNFVNEKNKRRVMFSAITYDGMEIGTSLLLWIDNNYFFIFSYQGYNKAGIFENEIPLVQSIETTITKCND